MIHAENGRVAIAYPPTTEGLPLYLAELTAIIAAVKTRLQKEPGMTEGKANQYLTAALFTGANQATTEETDAESLAEFFDKE